MGSANVREPTMSKTKGVPRMGGQVIIKYVNEVCSKLVGDFEEEVLEAFMSGEGYAKALPTLCGPEALDVCPGGHLGFATYSFYTNEEGRGYVNRAETSRLTEGALPEEQWEVPNVIPDDAKDEEPSDKEDL